MKDASESLRPYEGSDERALDESIPAGIGGKTSAQGGRLQTLKVPVRPRFPPRSDCAESIDPQR